MHDDFYQLYLEELDGLVPCSEAETKELAAAIQKNKPKAVERLIEGKLKQVLEIAKEYADQGVLMSDLVQEANMTLTIFTKGFQGLAEHYDKELAQAVRAQLEQIVGEQRNAEDIEAEILARVNVLQDISRMMADELNREATAEELAARMKMTTAEIKDIMKITLDALTVSPGTQD